MVMHLWRVSIVCIVCIHGVRTLCARVYAVRMGVYSVCMYILRGCVRRFLILGNCFANGLYQNPKP